MKYRKKPVVIEAIQFNGENFCEISEFAGKDIRVDRSKRTAHILTLEGEMNASAGDYIIRGIKGEIYPCKPDIFEATYDLVDDNDS